MSSSKKYAPAYQKCQRCKRRLQNSLVCNACVKKQNGGGNNLKHSVNYTFITMDVDETELPDVLLYMQSIRERIKSHLQDRLTATDGIRRLGWTRRQMGALLRLIPVFIL